jgi:hypothetical protein
VRPERVIVRRPTDGEAPGPGEVRGVIDLRTFLGSTYRLGIVTDHGRIVADVGGDGEALRREDAVLIRFDPATSIALAAMAEPIEVDEV